MTEADGAAGSVAAAEDATARRRQRKVHFPTSVLVTILVAALSVWLAPAITRQWDDRQKARELQGDVAAQVNVASADVVGELLALVDSSTSSSGSSMRELDAARKRWLVAQYRVSAQLDTYFSDRTQNQWALHSEVVDKLFALVRVVADPQSGVDPNPDLPNAVPRIRRYAVAQAIDAWAGAYENESTDKAYYLPIENYSGKGLRDWVADDVPLFALGSAGKVTDDIRQDHPRGFSTTRGDLWRDLLP